MAKKKPILARAVNKEDGDRLRAWMEANAENNAFDPRVLSYKATEGLCADRGNKPILYMLLQSCHVLDSLAPDPDASDADVALALDRLVSTVAFASRQNGRGEILFPCSDERTLKFAMRHGFEVINFPVLKMRLQ